MQNDYTHVHVLLDRSGSMVPNWATTVASMKSFIKEQTTIPGKMTLSLVTFNTTQNVNLDLLNVTSFNGDLELPHPSGGTALWDALCKEIDRLGQNLSLMLESERPSKILFAVFTDGEELNSTEYRRHDVSSRVAHQRDKYGWNFSFLGCGFDAESLAKSVGVDVKHCLNFDASKTKSKVAAFSQAVSCYRSSPSRSLDQNYSDVLRGN